MQAVGTGCLVVIVLVVGLAIFGWIKEAIDPYETCEDGGEGMAAVMVKEAVKKRLTDPGGAEFGWGTTAKIGENRYSHTNYVDAQNVFGGTIRRYFSAVAECRPSTQTWIVREMRFR